MKKKVICILVDKFQTKLNKNIPFLSLFFNQNNFDSVFGKDSLWSHRELIQYVNEGEINDTFGYAVLLTITFL